MKLEPFIQFGTTFSRPKQTFGQSVPERDG